MAIVTGLTAARMLAIEAASIVDGAVVGDNLILEKHDGSTIDAGSVRGPTGSTGATGSTGPAGAAAAFTVKATATSANVTQSGTQTVDGVALVAGDRVLCKSQTTPSQNGIWVVAAGAWSRASDADTSAEIAAALVRVQGGTLNGGTVWWTPFKSTDTIGTTAMPFYRMLATAYDPVIITFSGTTDASGYLTVTHGLGFTPSFVTIMSTTPGSNFPVMWGVTAIGGTTFQARFFNASTANAAVSLATGSQKALCFR